jgi:hypothetical protein
MVGALTTNARYSFRDPFAVRHGLSRYMVPRFSYVEDSLEFLEITAGIERLKSAVRDGIGGWRLGHQTITRVCESGDMP